MKKILPFICTLGLSALIVGCSNAEIKPNENTLETSINMFTESMNDYANINTEQVYQLKGNYDIQLGEKPEYENMFANDDELLNNDELLENEIINESEENQNEEINEVEQNQNEINNETNVDNESKENSTELSTLYSLNRDIADSCDQFCQLKDSIYSAITETQNLIEKVKNQQVELTAEQKLFISEQSNQIKNLSRELGKVTNELSFQMSDLSNLFTTGNPDIDSLNLKYFMILNNLSNGNDVLQNSLSCLNMINTLFNMPRTALIPNNPSRIYYAIQKNNEPPIEKEILFDENGNVIEDENSNENQTENTTENETKKFISNIDTYGNTYSNIDSFFNTALLDNRFMYGNRGFGYGMNGFNNGFNYLPYAGVNNGYGVNPNTMYGVQNNLNTQNVENTAINENQNNNIAEPEKATKKKKFQLNKNIDSYKTDNSNLKTKFASVKNFFQKFTKKDSEKNTESNLEKIKNIRDK